METQDIRRRRLRQLIEDRYDGSQAKLVEATGENQGEISALLRSKSFGEKKARKLEQKLDLPAGWLDQRDEPDSEELEVRAERGPVLVPVQTAEKALVSLVWVDQEELALLTAYRQATDLGKSTIVTAAEVAEKSTTSLLSHQS